MRVPLAPLFCLLGGLILTVSVRSAQADAALLQGAWQVVRVESGGTETQALRLQGERFRFVGQRISTLNKAQQLCSYRLPADLPGAIDIADATGEQFSKGIYAVSGNRLTLCLPQSTDAPRPTRFDTSDSPHLCLHCERRPRAETDDVLAVFARFFAAYRALDWNALEKTFTRRPTMFFPTSRAPAQLVGVDAIAGVLRPLFDGNRQRRDARPSTAGSLAPAMNLRVQLWGETALLTFEFHATRRSRYLERRTLVLTKQAGSWQIAHVHASHVEDIDSAEK